MAIVTIFHDRATLWFLDACDLLGSVGVFDLDSRLQIIPVEHPIQVHTAGPGDMCHGQAPALCHLDHEGEARSGK